MNGKSQRMNSVMKPDGYALIAALLIMFLMTSLGIWAMITSTTETRLTGAQSEEQMMFYYSEQIVDRVLSHLHYFDQGIFSPQNMKGLRYDFTDYSVSTATQILPKYIMSSTSTPRNPLKFSGTSVVEQDMFEIDVWIDPKDFGGIERRLSRPLAILMSVRNKFTGSQRGFRAVVEPHSIWDYAYASLNHNPILRDQIIGCRGTDPDGSKYDCQTVFHGPVQDPEPADPFNLTDAEFIRAGDSIVGDIYLRNIDHITAGNDDDSKMWVRGRPVFDGDIHWRSRNPYDLGTYSAQKYSNSPNQTAGGQSQSIPPYTNFGMDAQTKDIDLFPRDYLGNYDGSTDYFANADLHLEDPGDGYIWKIIFRNDINTNFLQDGSNHVEESRVASAITQSLNDGIDDDPGSSSRDPDYGVFLLYRIPWDFEITTDGFLTEQMKCAFYGNTMYNRHKKMTSAFDTDESICSTGLEFTTGSGYQVYANGSSGATATDYKGILWHPSVDSSAYGQSDFWVTSSGSGKVSGYACYGQRRNDLISDPTFGPQDTNDIQYETHGYTARPGYYFFYVPSQGQDQQSATCLGTRSAFNGIIAVEGSVMVSGIVDGRVTIVATGDVLIDHEIEYEQSPFTELTSTTIETADMLGLFAAGNIIVPNFRPSIASTTKVYWDDFSDAEVRNNSSESQFSPTGLDDAVKLYDDDGTEDIHAVMISYGYQGCTLGGTAGDRLENCIEPTDVTNAGDVIQEFTVGVTIWPRTKDGTRRGEPFYYEPAGSKVFQREGNDSGTLRIVGAIMQRYPGRFGWDYHNAGASFANSTCTGAAASWDCNFVGHNMMLVRDPQLQTFMPPFPGATNSGGLIPYGRASWEVVAWDEIDAEGLAGAANLDSRNDEYWTYIEN